MLVEDQEGAEVVAGGAGLRRRLLLMGKLMTVGFRFKAAAWKCCNAGPRQFPFYIINGVIDAARTFRRRYSRRDGPLFTARGNDSALGCAENIARARRRSSKTKAARTIRCPL